MSEQKLTWMLPGGYTEPTKDCPLHLWDLNCPEYGCVPYSPEAPQTIIEIPQTNTTNPEAHAGGDQ